MEFDENDAIAYIRNGAAGALNGQDDDQILNVIDAMYDWQEEHGLLEIDADPADIDLDQAAMAADIKRLLARDKGCTLNVGQIETVIHLELEYEDGLGSLDDD